MRDYLLKIFRVVAKIPCDDVKKLIDNLVDVYKNQVNVLATLSQRTADIGVDFLLQH
jgi:hypothetical protein